MSRRNSRMSRCLTRRWRKLFACRCFGESGRQHANAAGSLNSPEDEHPAAFEYPVRCRPRESALERNRGRRFTRPADGPLR